MLLCLFLLLNMEGTFGLTLGPIPGEDLFLERPVDLVVDHKGRILVLDASARKLMAWGPDGTFQTAVGRAGEGPGEFSLNSSAFLSVVDGNIYVFDNGARKMLVFDENLQFKDSQHFQVERGRADEVRVIAPNRFLVFHSAFFAEEPYRRIAFYSPDRKILQELTKQKEDTWHYIGDGGQRRVMMHGYAPELSLFFDRARGELLIGHSVKPKFEVYTLDGTLKETVEMKLGRPEITKKDQEEYEEQPWFRNSNGFFKAEYDETKSYYDRVLPIGGRGFLVFRESPVDRICDGVVVDRKGKTRKRFHLECGNGGSLYGSAGRIFAITNDAEGEYHIGELKL